MDTLDNVYVHYIVETMEDVDWDEKGAVKKAKELSTLLKTTIKVYKCVGYVEYHEPIYNAAKE
jgi:hypothetical protein